MIRSSSQRLGMPLGMSRLCRVDATTEYGRLLADAFGARKFPFAAVSSVGAQWVDRRFQGSAPSGTMAECSRVCLPPLHRATATCERKTGRRERPIPILVGGPASVDRSRLLSQLSLPVVASPNRIPWTPYLLLGGIGIPWYWHMVPEVATSRWLGIPAWAAVSLLASCGVSFRVWWDLRHEWRETELPTD